LVEVRETVKEITITKYLVAEQPVPPRPFLFADISDDDLLSHGVPAEWMDHVRETNEGTVLELADHLPGEAAEALLELATGVTPQITQLFAVGAGTVPTCPNSRGSPDRPLIPCRRVAGDEIVRMRFSNLC